MPDENKLAALDDLGFRLARVCGNCRHWTAPPVGWGHCALARHTHNKHVGERRAGTPEIGTCDHHALNQRALAAQAAGYTERFAQRCCQFKGCGHSAGALPFSVEIRGARRSFCCEAHLLGFIQNPQENDADGDVIVQLPEITG